MAGRRLRPPRPARGRRSRRLTTIRNTAKFPARNPSEIRHRGLPIRPRFAIGALPNRHGPEMAPPEDARVAQLVEQRIENPRVGGSNPSPGTIFSQSTENLRKSSSRRSSNSVCYTEVLHNRDGNSRVSVGNHSENDRRGCYTKVLHNRRLGLVLRGSIFYMRKRVPRDLRTVIGRAEIWKSLHTDSRKIAVRRLPFATAQIEGDFERARQQACLITDSTLLAPWKDDAGAVIHPSAPQAEADAVKDLQKAGPTLGEAYHSYLNDPTRSWAPTTRQNERPIGS